MKKTISVLLMAVMLLAVLPALADGTYITTQIPWSYILTQHLTDGVYPTVRLTTASESILDRVPEDGKREIRYLCFDAPDGAKANRFENDYAHYLDDVNKLQYSYQITRGTLDKTREKWEEGDGTVLDGPEGSVMCYYSTGMIIAAMEVPEYGENTVLRITINPDFYESYHVSPETNARFLIACMVPEVIRVKSKMHVELYGDFWNSGAFSGVEIPNDWDVEYFTRVDFPQTDVPWAQGTFTVMKYDGKVEGIYQYGDGPKQYTEVVINAGVNTGVNSSRAVTKLNDGDEAAREVTLSNGSKWTVYTNSSSTLYASKELNGSAVRSDSEKDKPFYINLELTPKEEDTAITEEDILRILEAYDASIEELFMPMLPEITVPEF